MVQIARDTAAFGVLILFGLSLTLWGEVLLHVG